jgi:hypothetical protein
MSQPPPEKNINRKDDISCWFSGIFFDWQAEGEQSGEPGDAGD